MAELLLVPAQPVLLLAEQTQDEQVDNNMADSKADNLQNMAAAHILAEALADHMAAGYIAEAAQLILLAFVEYIPVVQAVRTAAAYTPAAALADHMAAGYIAEAAQVILLAFVEYIPVVQAARTAAAYTPAAALAEQMAAGAVVEDLQLRADTLDELAGCILGCVEAGAVED